MKYWELIADKLTAAGFSWGYTSVVNRSGQQLFNVDLHAADGKRHIVQSDELLSAFLELECVLSE
jgi:hypothetical protein